MATILLQAVGGAVGTVLGGPVGGIVGRALGGLGGAVLDGALLSRSRRVEGPRLNVSRIQDADEGAGIARLYGTARVTGQTIWTTHFEEKRSTERQGGKGAGGEQTVTTYSYFGNVAVGLCEGPVAGIRRIWADGEELDVANVEVRVHRGGDDQMPDPLIEARQGAGNAPAYRGLAYLVFERLPLERWGNRLPQISCEVLRPVGDLERCIRAVTIIPGASEHALDTAVVRETVRKGTDRLVNRNMLFAESDVEASLDELTGLCPRLERAALVVSWFGDDLRAGSCTIRPGVETSARNESTGWRVGPTARGDARLISRNNGGPAYGGTPSDAGVVRAIGAMRARGLKVTFYPFILMDVPADNTLPDPYGGVRQASYPWRGRITLDTAPGRAGSPDRSAAAAEAIGRFIGTVETTDFTVEDGRIAYGGPPEWSYRRMVLHQAHLARLAGGVDAFLIGSELRGLTQVRDAAGVFPFVAALMALAEDVKRVLPEAKVTYAADWSEYFGYQPTDGSGDVFFHLDPLWAHPAIDMVGIDNYLPIADRRDDGPDSDGSPYDLAALRAGIAGGENADWFYASAADRNAGRRTPITDGLGKPWVFRSKDIVSWWQNPHRERRAGMEGATDTAWIPCSKPIWLTELGCAAIDRGANQPNVFVDAKSAESAVPHFSSGARDDLMQRRFLEAHLGYWDPASPEFRDADNPVSPVYGGRMVDAAAIHLWTWDARPYPAFPDLTDVWSDGDNWRRGHWLTGRLGSAPLDGLIKALLADHGFTDVDVTGVDAVVGGYLVGGPGSARTELEELMRLCGVVAHSQAGRLVFRSLTALQPTRALTAFAEDDPDGPLVELRRGEDSECAEEIVVGFSDPARAYQTGTAEASLRDRTFHRQDTIQLPVVLGEAEARRFASAVLGMTAGNRENASFALSPAAVETVPGDVVTLDGIPGRWLVTRIEDGAMRRVEARKLAPSQAAGQDQGAPVPAPKPNRPATVSQPVVILLDLPQGAASAPEDAPRIACFAEPFLPLAIDAARAGGPFETRGLANAPATVGELTAPLGAGPEGLVDRANALDVLLYRGALFSITHEQLLGGGNLCAVRARGGEWEVLQFERAEEVAPMRFRLTRLVRAQGGTEDAMAAGADAEAPFVLLDAATGSLGLKASEIGATMEWRAAAIGHPLDAPTVVTQTATLGLRAVRPLSPVHLRADFASDGAIRLGWTRRTRLDGDAWDGLDVPLGEAIERYRIVIANAAGREIVRESDASQIAVSADEQERVFGDLPPQITASVAQFSLRHGAGAVRRATFQRPS